MEKLRVFVSSKMAELRDVREMVAKALDDRGIEAWVYEAQAGARPEDVVETSLSEVEAADIYAGLFWQKYGEVTVEEYRYARELGKPCFIYIRDKDIQREKALEDFLQAEIYDFQKGVTYDYFDSAVKLGEQVTDDIMAWLAQRHRKITAEIQAARIFQEEIARLRAEVDRLQAASRERLPQGTPADYLGQQMRAWFETLGYRFESHAIQAEDYFEWIINVPARRRYDRILVRGIEGEAEMSDVVALRQAVDEQRTDEGWLVAARRKSQAACDEVEKKENRDLFCYTFDELLDEHADFSGYLDWLEAEIKRRGVDKMYVPLACTKEEFDPATRQKIGESRYDERNGWIDGYIDRWLNDPAKQHISILGEFGTGKTWFALHYAWTALQRYRQAKERGVERPRLPLVIPLRDYAKAVSVESLFSEFFFRKHEIPLPGYSAFEQLNRMGKLLLIFDGFDEMATRVDRQKMINNFWELARVVVPGAKAILTCRTEHFPEAREGRTLLSAELQASTAKLTGESPQFEVLELEKFDDVQIRQVLSLRAEPATVEQVMDNPELLDLARRPVMTEFILEALPDIEAGKPVDLSRVYLYAVRRKMERDIKAERTFTSLADKLYFLCELSWEMLSTDQMSLNYRLFPDRLRRLFGPAVQEQKDLDHWHYDMMGQTMLIRNADGDYTAAHRSILEFFVAYKFAAEMGVLAEDFTEIARTPTGPAVAGAINQTWSGYFLDDRSEAVPLRYFVVESMEKLVGTVGREPLSRAIRYLTREMVGNEKELWEKIEETRGKTFEDTRFLAGNVSSLLLDLHAERPIRGPIGIFKGKDFSRLPLRSTDFWMADLTDANLSQCDLQGSKFTFVKVQGTDFTFSNMSEAEWTFATRYLSLATNADCSRIIAGHTNGYEVWDRRPHHPVLLGQGGEIRAIAIDSTGRKVALADGKVIYLLENDEGNSLPALHSDIIFALSYNPDATLLASAGRDDQIIVWDVAKRTAITRIRSTFGEFAYSAVFSNNGDLIASAGTSSKVKFWDPITGQLVSEMKTSFQYCNHITYSPDGNYIVVAGQNLGAKPYNSGIAIWDAQTLTRIGDLWEPSAKISHFASFSPDSRLLFTRRDGNKIVVLKADGLKEICLLEGHYSTIRCMDVARDKKLAVTAGDDAQIRIWDVDPDSNTFGKCIDVLEQTKQFAGTLLTGAIMSEEVRQYMLSRGAQE